jgi:hypothetical protein
MVSGHLIIKPTITLQRLNLQDVTTSSPTEHMRSPLPESDEGIVFYCCLYILPEVSSLVQDIPSAVYVCLISIKEIPCSNLVIYVQRKN